MTKLRGWLVVLAILAAGCSTHQDDPNRAYDKVFRGRWWNYYERGVWHLAEGRYEAAQADFERALKGRSTDAWSARTYGLHFQEYFPNRELGVVQFRLGDLDGAEATLRKSVGDVDSARALYFLDEITRMRLASGALTDTAGPSLSASLSDGAVLGDRAVGITVDARDDVGVAEVTVNGNRLYQRASFTEASLAGTLSFDEGEHTIELAASDLAGKAGSQRLTVRTDYTAPTIVVTSPAPESVTGAESVPLRAIAVDGSALRELRILDGPASPAGGKRAELETTLALTPGENIFVIAAVDEAGNENRTAVRVFRGDRASAAARLWWLKHRAPDRLQVASLSPASLAAVLNTAYAQAEAPIAIEMTFPTPPDEKVYTRNELPVKGRVIAQAGLTALTVGGGNALPEDIGEVTGEFAATFDRRVALEPGDNAIVVAAADTAGNAAEETIDVKADFPIVDSPDTKMPVAVLTIGRTDSAGLYSDMPALSASLNQALQDRFEILERAELQAILGEQQLSVALGSPETALQLHNVSIAQYMIAGYFQELDAGTGIMAAKVIDCETTTVFAVDVALAATDGPAIEQALDDIATQIRARFPRLTGRLIGVNGDQLVADYNQNDGLYEGSHFLVLMKEPDVIDETTGEVIFPGEMRGIAARARIQRIAADRALGKVVTRQSEFDGQLPTITW